METITINDVDLGIVEYNGTRAVTFRNIDEVHHRPEGTARRAFYSNRKRFVLGEDYFMVYRGDNAMYVFRTLEIPPRGITLLTESGYLMLVKSFTDDLAWKVQRELVNCYFKVHQPLVPLAPPPKQMAIELPKRSMVVDTPNNSEAQKLMSQLRTAAQSIPLMLELFNRHMPEQEAEHYKHIINDFGMEVCHLGNELRRVKLNLIEQPL